MPTGAADVTMAGSGELEAGRDCPRCAPKPFDPHGGTRRDSAEVEDPLQHRSRDASSRLIAMRSDADAAAYVVKGGHAMIRTVIVLAGVVGLIGSAEFVGTAREPVARDNSAQRRRALSRRRED